MLLLFCQCRPIHVKAGIYHRKVSQRCRDIPAQVSITGNETKEKKDCAVKKRKKEHRLDDVGPVRYLVEKLRHLLLLR